MNLPIQIFRKYYIILFGLSLSAPVYRYVVAFIWELVLHLAIV